jgi:hypothetical protein
MMEGQWIIADVKQISVIVRFFFSELATSRQAPRTYTDVCKGYAFAPCRLAVR